MAYNSRPSYVTICTCESKHPPIGQANKGESCHLLNSTASNLQSHAHDEIHTNSLHLGWETLDWTTGLTTILQSKNHTGRFESSSWALSFATILSCTLSERL